MLFNSLEFIFVFLPVVLLVYFVLSKMRWILAAKIWLVGSSLFFYSWWNVDYLQLILISFIGNYYVAWALGKNLPHRNRKAIHVAGILFNIALLGYYKYCDFFISNLNAMLSSNLPLVNLLLPLGICLFLVDWRYLLCMHCYAL